GRERVTGAAKLRLAQAQQRWLVDVEVYPDRVEAHDFREDGPPARTHDHEIAGGDLRAARPARDRRGDAGEPEVEPGLRELGLGAHQLTLGRALAASRGVHLAFAHRSGTPQPLRATHLRARARQVGTQPGDVALALVDRGLILARVDLEEQVALLHQAPGIAVDLGDVS